MNRIGGTTLRLLLLVPVSGLADSPRPVPPDCKFRVLVYGVAKEPIRAQELILRRGRWFAFASDTDEVIMIDAQTHNVELLDLRRGSATEITSKHLTERFDRLHKALQTVTEKREKQGGRANEIAARMSRDLIEPRFESQWEPVAARLRLANATVSIDLSGEPEPDGGRLDALHGALTTLIQLEAVRDPEAIPPFPRLEALRVLTGEHHLRPVELTALYRLAGPPRKFRWTYRLEPDLEAREIQSLSRIRTLYERAQSLRFDRYERECEED